MAVDYYGGAHGDMVRSLNEYALKDYQAGAEAADTMSRHLNGGSTNTYVLGFVAQFQREHRYLQGEMITALLNIVGSMANQGTDPRNEIQVEWCAKVRTLLVQACNWYDPDFADLKIKALREAPRGRRA